MSFFRCVRRSLLSSTVRGQSLRRRFSSTSLLQCSEEEKINIIEGKIPPNCDTPSFIHPSAIVHPNAILGQGISIGPFCTIGPLAKLGNSCKLYPGSHISGSTELGNNCTLMTGAVIGDDLPGCTFIGCNNIMGQYAVIGTKCQDMKYMPGSECFLEIGDNNEIREHTSIHRSSKPSDKTVIGDNNLIMGSCHIAHDCKVGNHNIFANNTLMAGHVIVESAIHAGLFTHCRSDCYSSILSYWLIFFYWWWFSGLPRCAKVHDGVWRKS